VDTPIYDKGTINYRSDKNTKIVEFYYPTNIGWNCTECGACCGDVDKKTRMILLLPSDIKRIKDTKKKNFYQEWSEGKFIGLMSKNENGMCIFHNIAGCSIYEQRTLLCRMYPFWLEKKDASFVFGISHDCPGTNKEKGLKEAFFANLLQMALHEMDY
jgi:Fe-S-cluster containining protein